MKRCPGCARDLPDNELSIYATFITGESGFRRISSQSDICSRCYALKYPDADHPKWERSEIPDCIREAFPDGNTSWPDEEPEAQQPAEPTPEPPPPPSTPQLQTPNQAAEFYQE